MDNSTKRIWTADEMKEGCYSNDKWLMRALVSLYNKQTSTEQSIMETHESNGVGFSGTDGHILTSIAKFYIKYGYVSEKQKAIVLKKIGKYAKQLAKIANGEI